MQIAKIREEIWLYWTGKGVGNGKRHMENHTFIVWLAGGLYYEEKKMKARDIAPLALVVLWKERVGLLKGVDNDSVRLRNHLL